MSRLPIRWRLALAFALAMAVVLGALGAFLYVRLEQLVVDGLDETLELRAQRTVADSNDWAPPDDEGVTQLFRCRRSIALVFARAAQALLLDFPTTSSRGRA